MQNIAAESKSDLQAGFYPLQRAGKPLQSEIEMLHKTSVGGGFELPKPHAKTCWGLELMGQEMIIKLAPPPPLAGIPYARNSVSRAKSQNYARTDGARVGEMRRRRETMQIRSASHSCS